MMRVLFVYPNENLQPALQVGVSSLSGLAKEKGHQTSLFDTTFIPPNQVKESFSAKIASYKPDLLAVSCRSLEWPAVKNLLKIVPAETPVIAGGAHPTVSPEQVLLESRVDAIVIGEGEGAFSDILDAVEQKKEIRSIPNVWTMDGDEILRNDPRPLIENLDTLPDADWSIFDPNHMMNIVPTKAGHRVKRRGSFETSRGCPFHCAYCINAHMQKLYRGKGKYHRDKSIDRAIGEIVDYRSKYDFNWVYFIDETLIAKAKRAKEFFTEYEKHVRLPFSLMVQPKMADEESLRLAAKAGAQIALIGVESGNEEFREQALRRKVSDEQMIQAFDNAKKAGLATYSFNIVGFPGETREMISETIDLNRRIRPDVVQVTIFYPFPGTELFDVCVEKGYLPPEGRHVANYYSDSVLEMPTISREQIRRVAKLFPLYAKWDEKWHGLLARAEENATWFSLFRIVSLMQIVPAGIVFLLSNLNNPSYLFRRIRHFLFGS